MKCKFYVLIYEIHNKRKESKHGNFQLSCYTYFRVSKQRGKPKLHNFHNRKKEASTSEGRQLSLNLKSEKCIMAESLSTIH